MATVPDPGDTPWVTVPEGGFLLAGLGRSASYDAARRGDLPVLRVGGRLVVPVAALRRLLQLDEPTASSH